MFVFASLLDVSDGLAAQQTATLKQQIAQKIILDLRYFCEDKPAETCRTPLTQLPDSIADMIAQTDLGGVILFAKNLVDIAQIIKLNSDLQQASARSALQTPLFISIDQEGGRVARLPRQTATSFIGNMSIGATYKNHASHYAAQVGAALAAELAVLGFNVNYAPNVDVNNNPDNPVINVRSFGEDPSMVAKLGKAKLEAFQKQGIIATLKHFPGHGDTLTDSHTGLPRVNHDFAKLQKVDLVPFNYIIRNAKPGMVMTAHIQFPSLDASTLVTRSGSRIIKPATMSKVILNDLLREKIGYEGVIITDALDMAGISDYFDQTEAVVHTFAAGADIALMPIKVRNSADTRLLPELIDAVVTQVKKGQLNRQEIYRSYVRIQQLKAHYLKSKNASIEEQIKLAKQTLAHPRHKVLETQLAEQSITLVQGELTPLKLKLIQPRRIHLIMPDKAKCLALSQAIANLSRVEHSISCTPLSAVDHDNALVAIEQAELVIAGHISPQQSVAEMGGMDDLSLLSVNPLDLKKQRQSLHRLLLKAKQSNKLVTFIALRAPYEAAEFGCYADVVLASYAYNVITDMDTQRSTGPAYSAIARVLTGQIVPQGSLPVSIPKQKCSTGHFSTKVEY
jgi:beta-N-acetylhexosaminidase